MFVKSNKCLSEHDREHEILTHEENTFNAIPPFTFYHEYLTLGGSTRPKIIAKKALKPVELALWPESTEWGNHPLYDYDNIISTESSESKRT